MSSCMFCDLSAFIQHSFRFPLQECWMDVDNIAFKEIASVSYHNHWYETDTFSNFRVK